MVDFKVKTLRLPLAVGIIGLGGCAVGLLTFQVTTTTYRDATYAPGGTIAVVPSDPKQSSSLEFQHFKSIIATKLAANGYALTDDVTTANQFALVAYGVDDGKSEVVSYPVYGQISGGSTYSSGTVSTSSGMASYSGSSYQMPQYGVVGNSVGTVTVFSRVFALDILDGNSFRANVPKKLLELRSKSSGSCGIVAAAIPYVIEGAFVGFPAEDGKVSRANVRAPKEIKC